MQVEQWMNRDLVTVKPDDSFRLAMDLIRQKGIRHLPVVEGKRLVGIVTDRDLRQSAPSPGTLRPDAPRPGHDTAAYGSVC